MQIHPAHPTRARALESGVNLCHCFVTAVTSLRDPSSLAQRFSSRPLLLLVLSSL